MTIDGGQSFGNVRFINMTTEEGNPSSYEDVTITTKNSGIHYTVTKDGLFCPLTNGQTSGTEADYTGNLTLTAFDSSGTTVEQQVEMGEITF